MSSENKQYATQKQRWVKYGANVVIASILVVVLAGAMVYAVQRARLRFDTTRDRIYSLKPQTVNVLKDIKTPIKIVSLYNTKSTRRGVTDEEQRAVSQTVEDLLNEYRSAGKNIQIEVLDPQTNPTKVDALIADVTSRYGGEVKRYKEFIDSGYAKLSDPILAQAKAESELIGKLPVDQISDGELRQKFPLIASALDAFPEQLNVKEQIARLMKQSPPDYKGAANLIRDNLSSLQLTLGLIQTALGEAREATGLPAPVTEYVAAAGERFKKLETDIEAAIKSIDSLGELKLDALKQSLRERDTILVLGETDLRVLSYDKVWRVEEQARAIVRSRDKDTKIKPRFAGEQQITSAIVSLSRPEKQKIAFVRPGGPPVTEPGIPGFRRGGEFSDIAERLRDLNFEVLEKDLSGQWAMQSQMRGSPAEPEPSDEDLKKAIWVVLALPSQNSMGGMTPTVGPQLQKHLNDGGSALILMFTGSDNLGEALQPFGIEADSAKFVVHEEIQETGAQGDEIASARRSPPFFMLSEYGEHPLTKPLKSLESLLVVPVPVKTVNAEGVTVMPLLPIPNQPKTWTETDIQAVGSGDPVKFDPEKGDAEGPFYSGAAAERTKDGARVVLLGSVQFATNGFLSYPDMDLLRRGVVVSRFPGNAELITNSVYWLAKMDSMIAISPAAMEVPRIAAMSSGALNFWRVGVLLIALPGMVLLSGLIVYFKRRD